MKQRMRILMHAYVRFSLRLLLFFSLPHLLVYWKAMVQSMGYGINGIGIRGRKTETMNSLLARGNWVPLPEIQPKKSKLLRAPFLECKVKT